MNFMVIAVLVAAATGYVFVSKAYAVAGVLDTRSITMSSSANAATNVRYSVSFKIGTTGNVGGIVIDFCTEDPIPTDTCTIPTSFNTNKATNTINNQVGISGVTIDTTNSTSKTLILTRTAASISAGTTVSFDIGVVATNGFTNPATTNTSFYARMFTYAATGGGSAYTSTVPGTYVDTGGIALTTTAQLVITSKVQEQLALCVYTGANCGAGGTAITLGDANGILNTAHVYAAIGKFDASTNAANGMNIFANGTTLTSPQSNTIAAIGATALASSIGTEQFGFCVGTTGGSVTAATPYNDNNTNCNAVTAGADTTSTTKFGYDVTSSPNMTTAGGMKIASSSAPSTTTSGKLIFMANIAVTTKAGVYTTTQTYIGIGSF